MSTNDNVFDFLQQSASAAADYVKFNDGDKRSLRLLSKPVAGYELFVDGKPVRWEQDGQRPDHAISDERPKKFVAFIVYEYSGQSDTGAVKLWELHDNAASLTRCLCCSRTSTGPLMSL